MNRFLRANIIRNDSEIETLRTNETLSTPPPSHNCFYAWFVQGAGVTNKFTNVEGVVVEASIVTDTIQPPYVGAEYRGMVTSNVPLATTKAINTFFRGVTVDNLNGLMSTQDLNLQPEGTKIFVRDEPAVSPSIFKTLRYVSYDGTSISREEKIEELEGIWEETVNQFNPRHVWVTNSAFLDDPDEAEAALLVGIEEDHNDDCYFTIVGDQICCLGVVHVVDKLLGFSLGG
jgi:hypothetical protein